MQSLKKLKIIILLLVLFFGIGSFAHGFTSPIMSAPGKNAAEPIDTSTNDQIKLGGLSVNAFVARNNAIFSWDRNRIDGLVRGGQPTDTTSTVNIGGGANQANLTATGNIRSKKMQSGALAHSQSGLMPICADASGNLSLCASVPSGGAPIYARLSIVNIQPSFYCGTDYGDLQANFYYDNLGFNPMDVTGRNLIIYWAGSVQGLGDISSGNSPTTYQSTIIATNVPLVDYQPDINGYCEQTRLYNYQIVSGATYPVPYTVIY